MADITPFPTWLPPVALTGGAAFDRSLRPLSIGELLDRAFQLLRAQYWALARAVLLFSVPCSVLSAFAARSLTGGRSLLSFGSVAPANSGANGAWIVVPYLVALLAPALVAGPVCRIAAAAALGRPLPSASAWRQGLRRLPVYLALTVLAVLSAGVGLLLCTIPGVLLWTMWRLALPAAAIEGGGPLRALGRSWSLVRSRFWPVLAVALLALVVDYAVGQLLGVVPALVASLIGLHWGFLLLAAASSMVATVTWSFTLIAETLLYLDIRVRREGLDLAWRIQSLQR